MPNKKQEPAFAAPPTSDEMKLALSEFSSAVYDAYVAMEAENKQLREKAGATPRLLIQTVDEDKDATGALKDWTDLVQRLTQMQAMLEQISRSVPIILREGEELDEWYCPVCSVSLPATVPLKPPPSPFPHAESCALAQSSALLAEEEQSNGE